MSWIDPEDVIHAAGPWVHRDISANGARFHVCEAGTGPLVLLVHGFPMFWWTWRHTLPVLAEAGYRAVAMDLRGYGGSDHPPRGYDPFTVAADIAGVIRSLGERNAIIVGHGWGGFLTWTAAVTHPSVVRGIAPLAMPHPRRMRKALLGSGAQRRASDYLFRFQLPTSPERDFLEDNAAEVGDLLRRWSADDTWLDEHTEGVYRSAMLLLNTAHCALEYHRWALRSIPRPDGIRYAARMKTPISVPVLHVLGAEDPTVLAATAEGSADYVRGPYQLLVLPGVGHFPHEEAPEEFHELLLPWLGTHFPPTRGN
ncbi:MAG: alpha/beta fold hydrolase [Candidatus Nanopelagicales bacterium]